MEGKCSRSSHMPQPTPQLVQHCQQDTFICAARLLLAPSWRAVCCRSCLLLLLLLLLLLRLDCLLLLRHHGVLLLELQHRGRLLMCGHGLMLCHDSLLLLQHHPLRKIGLLAIIWRGLHHHHLWMHGLRCDHLLHWWRWWRRWLRRWWVR